jgi:hypothetical protein
MAIPDERSNEALSREPILADVVGTSIRSVSTLASRFLGRVLLYTQKVLPVRVGQRGGDRQ